MELKHVDKTLYKQRLNRLQGGMVLGLLVLALGLSELLRALFGGTGENNGHTLLNGLAVVLSALILSGVFRTIRDQPWMADIRYTWKLKQELNRIYRHVKFVEAEVAENNPEALKVYYFSLHGSKHLYEIEDNTLTVPELNDKIAALDEKLQGLELTLSVNDYEPWLVDSVKHSYKAREKG